MLNFTAYERRPNDTLRAETYINRKGPAGHGRAQKLASEPRQPGCEAGGLLGRTNRLH